MLAAELQLVLTAHEPVVLGCSPDIAQPPTRSRACWPPRPTALEAIDHKLVSFERTRSLNPDALDLLPDAGAWLVVQGGGDSREEADAAGDRILEAAGRQRDDDGVAWFDDPRKEQELWRVRESALGATSRLPGHSDAWPGWEDSAVHPDRLGDYLRDLRGLLDEFGYGEASLYGHFGQGCVHCRIPFELTTAPGVAAFRRFVERAAELVAAHGGSLSGEHGDGQARGELLPTMFGDEVGRRSAPARRRSTSTTSSTPARWWTVPARRRPAPRRRLRAPQRAYLVPLPRRRGQLLAGGAAGGRGGVPQHRGRGHVPLVPGDGGRGAISTRGRSRLLFEMLDGGRRGGPIADGWRSEAVLDALDLCLACKGCRSDCPVDVDMATYKAEFLAHHYRHRLRPRTHYSMGWLPVAAALARGPRGWSTRRRACRLSPRSPSGWAGSTPSAPSPSSPPRRSRRGWPSARRRATATWARCWCGPTRSRTGSTSTWVERRSR
ncbi:MAG: FAD-linked oxidase C-terminal domain-containing protein [Acidimicrobiales bacterium]